jgi:hypothetical protein
MTPGQLPRKRARWQDRVMEALMKATHVPPFVEQAPTIVAITTVRIGTTYGQHFSPLRRGVSEPSVVVLDDERVIVDRGDDHPHVTMPFPELRGLRAIIASWHTARSSWAAYSGDGETRRYRGFRPLWYWAPGAAHPVMIERENPHFACMRAGAFTIQIGTDRTTLGEGHASRALTSSLGEPAGVVIAMPHGRTVVALRHLLVVSGPQGLGDSSVVALAAADPDWRVQYLARESVYPAGGLVLDARGSATVTAAADAGTSGSR